MGSMSDYTRYTFLGYDTDLDTLGLDFHASTSLILGTKENPQYLYVLPFYFRGLVKDDWVEFWVPDRFDTIPFNHSEEYQQLGFPLVNHEGYASAALHRCIEPGTFHSELLLKVNGKDMHELLQRRKQEVQERKVRFGE